MLRVFIAFSVAKIANIHTVMMVPKGIAENHTER